MASVSVANDVDPLDEAVHVRPELAANAVASPARPHVRSRDGRAVGETSVLAQCDDPDGGSLVEPPGRSQTWTDTAHAVDPDERLIELTEEQSLAAFDGWSALAGSMRSREADGRDRFPGRGDQRALIDGRTRQRVSARGARFRLRA